LAVVVKNDDEAYPRVSRVLDRVGVRVGYGGEPIEGFLGENCPAVVFRYTQRDGQYLYVLPKEQEQIFAEFVKERKRQLGI